MSETWKERQTESKGETEHDRGRDREMRANHVFTFDREKPLFKQFFFQPS